MQNSEEAWKQSLHETPASQFEGSPVNAEDMSRSKVFVGGLAPTVTQDMLREYCIQYGEVEDAVVMIDKFTQRSRGFGFVTFVSPESVTTLMATRNVEHQIDGKRVQFKRAVPASFAYNPEKIFIGGLPGTCDSDKLKEYFERYGSVIDAQVMYDKSTGRSRGFGYVNYETAEAVESVLKDFHEHTIDGKWVEVKRCLPNDSRKHRAGSPQGAMSGNMGRAASGYPGSYGNAGRPPANLGAAAALYSQMAMNPYAYMNPYAAYDPYTAAAFQAMAPQLAALYGYDPTAYGYEGGYPQYAGGAPSKKGGKGMDAGTPAYGPASPPLGPLEGSPSAMPRGYPSPNTFAENPPMTEAGALDVAAIFQQLNQ